MLRRAFRSNPIITLAAKHDKLYHKLFSPSERLHLEAFSMPDMLLLRDGSGPKHEVRCHFGLRFVAERKENDLVSSLFTTGSGPKLTDAALLGKVEACVTSHMEATSDELSGSVVAAVAPELPEGGKEMGKLAAKLALLTRTNMKTGGGGAPTTAAELGATIVRRTDEVLKVAEEATPIFTVVLDEIVRRGGDAGVIVRGPLKDPVRIHEKAVNDYATRFSDGVLPESNVLDVIRARLVTNRAGLLVTLESLEGLEVAYEGAAARVEIVRCKSKFSKLDPTHFRNYLLNIAIVYKGSRYFGEVQVHHKDILGYNDDSHAHDHYDFFRMLLADRYDEALGESLDFILEERMRVFYQISQTPVLLSMLIVCMRESTSHAGSGLPEDIFQLYETSMRVVVQQRFKEDKGKAEALVRLLQAVGCANSAWPSLELATKAKRTLLSSHLRILVWQCSRSGASSPGRRWARCFPPTRRR